MDDWKFEDFLKKKALYFRRSDRLEDGMEGKYAEANRIFFTNLWKRFIEVNGVAANRHLQEQDALSFRYFAFINCWHLNRIESPSMWKTFCKSPNSVVVVSTVRKVAAIVQKRKGFAIGRVHYENQSIPRPEWSRFAPYFYKDPKFFGEKEYRLIVFKDANDPYVDVDLETDTGVLVSCEPALIVDEVFIHPNAAAEFRDKIKRLLRDHGSSAGVHRSRIANL